jgi:hypothetical protein
MAIRVSPQLLPFFGRIIGYGMDMSFALCAEAGAAVAL